MENGFEEDEGGGRNASLVVFSRGFDVNQWAFGEGRGRRVWGLWVVLLGVWSGAAVLAGCSAGARGAVVQEDGLREVLLEDKGFTVNRPPEDASPQRVASFRSAAAGYSALQKGNLYEAEDLLERALGLDPRNPFSYLYLAEVRIQQGEMKQALVFLDQSELRFQGHPYWLCEVYTRKGLCLERLGSAEQALGAYRKALEYDPSNRTSREALQRLKGSSQQG